MVRYSLTGTTMATTTIQLQDETKAALDKLKIIDREPYDSVIQRLLKEAKARQSTTSDSKVKPRETKA